MGQSTSIMASQMYRLVQGSKIRLNIPGSFPHASVGSGRPTGSSTGSINVVLPNGTTTKVPAQVLPTPPQQVYVAPGTASTGLPDLRPPRTFSNVHHPVAVSVDGSPPGFVPKHTVTELSDGSRIPSTIWSPPPTPPTFGDRISAFIFGKRFISGLAAAALLASFAFFIIAAFSYQHSPVNTKIAEDDGKCGGRHDPIFWQVLLQVPVYLVLAFCIFLPMWYDGPVKINDTPLPPLKIHWMWQGGMCLGVLLVAMVVPIYAYTCAGNGWLASLIMGWMGPLFIVAPVVVFTTKCLALQDIIKKVQEAQDHVPGCYV